MGGFDEQRFSVIRFGRFAEEGVSRKKRDGCQTELANEFSAM